MTAPSPDVFVGLMSGTSADGIDAVVARFGPALLGRIRGGVAGARKAQAPEFLVHRHEPFDDAVRARILSAPTMNVAALALLNVEMGRRFGSAAAQALATSGVNPSDVGAVVSAGLTVCHLPPGGVPAPVAAAADSAVAEDGATLALGDGDVIAEECGLLVLSDLRARDRAAGGQGAPLVPFADEVLLAQTDRVVAALNLGGIANVTVLDPEADVAAFDIGPGNMLIDGWIERSSGGARRMDTDGALAGAGRVDAPWLAELLAADEFVAAPPPKSTGRERYGADFLERHAARLGALPLADALATLTAYTVECVALTLTALPRAPDELVVSGGGALNATLMQTLTRRLAPMVVRDSADALGIPVLAKEALAMAIIGAASVAGVPGNIPAVTGARRRCVLGKVCLPPGSER